MQYTECTINIHFALWRYFTDLEIFIQRITYLHKLQKNIYTHFTDLVISLSLFIHLQKCTLYKIYTDNIHFTCNTQNALSIYTLHYGDTLQIQRYLFRELHNYTITQLHNYTIYTENICTDFTDYGLSLFIYLFIYRIYPL